MFTLALLALSGLAAPQGPIDALAQGFRNPPASARPHTWWHWMNGNVTKDGITADLEAMRRVGIGGAQLFTVPEGIPPGPAGYMSPEWREMTKWAVEEAGRLGIELCLHNCAGWSSSGGPWITPENAMRVVAWSTLEVQGPSEFSGALPEAKAPQVAARVDDYRDIAVFAIPSSPETNGPLFIEPRGAFLGKTGVVRQDGIEPDDSTTPQVVAVNPRDLLDLTSKLDRSGRLTWRVPRGNWTVLRMGHVPTGKTNHPSPPEGEGLEVDKLSREALRTHWDGIMAKVLADVGPLAGKVLNNALIDSYEVGSQNWTPRMREEFQSRRGYDPRPFLPALAGLVVESKEHTERFLWDWRRTIADLFADNYFRYFGELCRTAGLEFSTEPYGNGGFDNIQVGGTSDIPMGEFWIGGGAMESTKLASSVGHVYGRNVIGAESFTSDQGQGRFLATPYAAKALGDLVFCSGINRYIFHRYAMQPWKDLEPGMTMGPWGSHFERTQTWWQGPDSAAAEWLRYVARCQFMLQQGRFAADALYCTGEGAPADLPYRPGLKPALPAGYDYDGCDAGLILKSASVVNGRIALPSGMSYSVLVMPDSRFMTPAMARKVRDLVRAGANIVCRKPEKSPSLTDWPASDAEVARIAGEVFGDLDGKSRTSRRFGKGTVYWGAPLERVFSGLGLRPDFEFKGKGVPAKLAYIHRRLPGGDAYFVSNQRYRWTTTEATFRVRGKMPELWHADTGLIVPAPVFREANGRTTVELTLGPAESVFVVFRKPAPRRHLVRLEVRGAPGDKPPPKIRVLSAHYGTDDGRGADVTNIVRSLVAQGETEIPATNAVFGDPLVNVVKRLRVEFEVDGRRTVKSVPENQSAVLVEGSGAGAEPPVRATRSDKGNVELIASKGARCEVTWSNGKKSAVAVGAPRVMAISGPWRVEFQANRGAPSGAIFGRLHSWTEHKDDGVKYFSGTARYAKEFSVPAGFMGEAAGARPRLFQPRAITLDLGSVREFARVVLNGRRLAVLWKEPFRVDVSNALRTGANRLEIEVTNLWPNRLIGDEQLPPDVEWDGVRLKEWPEWLRKGQSRPKTGRIAFTTWRFYTKESPLLESGLLGPVVIRSAIRQTIR